MTQELMIGDWVCYSKANKYYTRVNEIRHTEVPLDDQWYIEGIRSDNDKINSNAVEYFSVEILSPIPLTPEILEKNGFIGGEYKSYTGYVWYLEEKGFSKIGFTMSCEKSILWGEKIKPNGSIGDNFSIPNIQFVHELQHALRLCGIDKEIEI